MSLNREIRYGELLFATKVEQGGRQFPEVILPISIEDKRGERNYQFSIGLGDITQAPVGAIMCPMPELDSVVLGGVSGAIFHAAGLESDITLQKVKDEIAGEYGKDVVSRMPFSLSRAFPSNLLVQRGLKKLFLPTLFLNKASTWVLIRWRLI